MSKEVYLEVLGACASHGWIKLLLDDHMCFNKTAHQLIRLIWYKIGSWTICSCSGRRICGPLARRTATRWATTCRVSWRGNPTRALTTALSH
ncbi:Transposable element tcb2 transposase [Caligus rogercresseyi]|uniref:Transposable element tcb2 transposase n=1 Tax=Caligus rogercresseyi TaxID=217165 RepID=A0A7T8HI32_CALRO|nr:Transposable element tcb2 transposase [Caligus rogercresseyi]